MGLFVSRNMGWSKHKISVMPASTESIENFVLRRSSEEEGMRLKIFTENKAKVAAKSLF